MSTAESNIETFVLKVHMNCQGCINRVRKLLRKIEGVYKVHINEEEQKVIVMGRVDPSTLVKKLAKSGKPAEIWNANQEQSTHDDKDNENDHQTQYVNPFENHCITPTLFEREYHLRRPESFLNQNMGTKVVERELDQNFATSMLIENVENGIANYGVLGNQQEWRWSPCGLSPISKSYHPPSEISDTHGYYSSHHPTELMHLSHHNCL